MARSNSGFVCHQHDDIRGPDADAVIELLHSFAQNDDMGKLLRRLVDLIASARREEAAKALRQAARQVYNGAPDLVTEHGDRFHMQSLYNEGAAPWLEHLADQTANGTHT